MINLYKGDGGERLGEISEDELQFLINELEEEFAEDQDYAITPLVLSYFEERNANPHLLGLLRQALDGQEEVIIRWARE